MTQDRPGALLGRIPPDPRIAGARQARVWTGNEDPAEDQRAVGSPRDRARPARPLPGPPGGRRVRHRRRTHRYRQRARGRLETAVRRVPEAAAARRHEPFRAFEEADYLRHVDGRARYDGVAGFLASRAITLPWGDPADPPGRETVCGLGNAKDRFFVAHLRDHGARAFPTSVAFVRRLRAGGLRTAAVSASRNMVAVLEAAGLRELFDVEVDGVEADRLGLAGKPDPALFLEAARRLGVPPGRAAVVEDALAGVEAGRRGRFGAAVGVDRGGQAAALAERGADVVVGDLGELALDGTALRRGGR